VSNGESMERSGKVRVADGDAALALRGALLEQDAAPAKASMPSSLRSVDTPRKTPWPHAPLHQLSVSGTYFVTAGTYHKEHHFRGTARLRVLHSGLLTVAQDFGWRLEAWAVFSNHYHFVAHSPESEDGAQSLSRMLGLLHEKTAKWLNRLDHTLGRQVWHNFRETRLTYEKSYLARLNYVHQNPVKHGLVPVASQYPWGSASWFERTARPAQVKTIYSFKVDQLRVYDEYEVAPEW
jgi:putative transposase